MTRSRGLWLAPIQLAPIGGANWLVRNMVTGEFHPVDQATYEVLLTIVGDRRPDAPIKIPPRQGRVQHVAKQLGLLLSEQQLLERLSNAGGRSSGRIGAVTIVTKNRPNMLRRCLSRLLENREQFGRAYRVIVVDHSNGARQQQNRDLLSELGRRHACGIEHLGTRHLQANARRLARRAGADASLLSFALTGVPYSRFLTFGAAFNSALLHTAGTLVASFDDDIVPAAMSTSFFSGDDEVLFADGDPTVMSIYDGAGDVTAAVTRCDADVIGCHESLLGGNIGWVTRTQNVRVHPDSAGGAKLLRCSSGRGSIAVTALGIAGDCGQWSLHYYAHLRGDSLKRLLGERPGYRRLRHSRHVVRAAPVPTITGGGFLMGGAIALDNRRPTIPFLPICRNSDGLWSHCLLTCFDELFVAFLPVVVSHEPPSRRVGVANQANAAVVRLSELLISVVHQLGLANMSSPGDAKVDLLGRSIAHLASLPGPIFERALRDLVEAVLIARLVEIRERLETSASELHQEPVWRLDLERQATAIKSALIQGRLHIDEFQHAGAAQVRRLLAIAGEVFQCWHSVWTAARDSDLVASRGV